MVSPGHPGPPPAVPAVVSPAVPPASLPPVPLRETGACRSKNGSLGITRPGGWGPAGAERASSKRPRAVMLRLPSTGRVRQPTGRDPAAMAPCAGPRPATCAVAWPGPRAPPPPRCTRRAAEKHARPARGPGRLCWHVTWASGGGVRGAASAAPGGRSRARPHFSTAASVRAFTTLTLPSQSRTLYVASAEFTTMIVPSLTMISPLRLKTTWTVELGGNNFRVASSMFPDCAHDGDVAG
mmetsp:Transcript_72882/g.206136  ORF Transcript_72882/g.206136 Transcript_72882/m.206136 type:complete len:239 (+) Transcript_72882:2-718(+)